jgi:hypothetical protein
MRERGELAESDEVVVFATGSGLKHLDLMPGGYPTVDPNDPDNGRVIDSAYPS